MIKCETFNFEKIKMEALKVIVECFLNFSVRICIVIIIFISNNSFFLLYTLITHILSWTHLFLKINAIKYHSTQQRKTVKKKKIVLELPIIFHPTYCIKIFT